MQGLKDIKGLLEIPDYSLYLFLALMMCLILIVFYILKRVVFKKKILTPRELMIQELKNINLNDAKKSAYTLTKAINILEDDKFDVLVSTLEKYKYKKTVMHFSEDEIEKIKQFLKEYND